MDVNGMPLGLDDPELHATFHGARSLIVGGYDARAIRAAPQRAAAHAARERRGLGADLLRLAEARRPRPAGAPLAGAVAARRPGAAAPGLASLAGAFDHDGHARRLRERVEHARAALDAAG